MAFRAAISSSMRRAPLAPLVAVRPATIAITHTAGAMQSHQRNKHVRPVSPHVTIYDWPVPALSSITHRATGTALAVGVIGTAALGLSGSCDIPAYVQAFQQGYPIIGGPIAKFLVGLPLSYHFIAGARHAYWDYTGKGFELADVEKSSKAIVVGSVVAALGLSFVTI